jgi:hypothetical protein
VTLAADTRDAVRERPFLYQALRAGVVNYSAAARYLDVEGETDAIVAALRRFADELADRDVDARDARVTMKSGIGEADASEDALLSVGDLALAPDAGSLTAIVANGDVDAPTLAHVIGRLDIADVTPTAAAVGDETLTVVVERRAGPDALRIVESALATVEK